MNYEIENKHLSAASGNDKEPTQYLFEYIVNECREGYKRPNINCPFDSEECYVGDRCIHCCMKSASKITEK